MPKSKKKEANKTILSQKSLFLEIATLYCNHKINNKPFKSLYNYELSAI